MVYQSQFALSYFYHTLTYIQQRRMTIIHKIDKFLLELFPQYKNSNNDLNILKDELINYYSIGPYKPIVTVEDNLIIIQVDISTITDQEPAYRKCISLCEKGKYEDAKLILKDLITRNPANSEYHRIMGQIISDEGDQDEAINYLIDALRWDSKNGWALLMMGNIFAKFKGDIETALTYYDQSLKTNTTDYISLTNIGYLLMQQDKLGEAQKFLLEALKINKAYPNTHFTLAMIAELQGDLQSGFICIIEAIKSSTQKDTVYHNAVKKAFSIANSIIEKGTGKKLFREYRHKLEFDGETSIDIVEDATISTAAKIEFAENYDRQNHLVKFKPGFPAVEHLIMHELVHLAFVMDARKDNINQLFISNQQHKSQFIKELETSTKKLSKLGIEDEAIAKYGNSIFIGINSQIYNGPIDLFIEDFLYNDFPELRPYQFISLFTNLQNGIKAVTDKKVVELSPPDILSKSKIYNLVNALQFAALYGIDAVQDHKATAIEIKQAQAFFDEYLQYQKDKEPAEEYELIQNWAEDLKLQNNFELVDEKEYRTKRTDIDNLLSSIEKDPYDLESTDPHKERELAKFQKSQQTEETNMAIVMYMVGALEFFKPMPMEKIKEIAYDIAFQGTQGFSPGKDDYRITAIPGKLFSGLHILSYYYVSWVLAMPKMVDQLGLSYTKEYEMAEKLLNKN